MYLTINWVVLTKGSRLAKKEWIIDSLYQECWKIAHWTKWNMAIVHSFYSPVPSALPVQWHTKSLHLKSSSILHTGKRLRVPGKRFWRCDLYLMQAVCPSLTAQASRRMELHLFSVTNDNKFYIITGMHDLTNLWQTVVLRHQHCEVLQCLCYQMKLMLWGQMFVLTLLLILCFLQLSELS